MTNKKIKVLYVEDDDVLAYIITDFLKKRNFEVTHCINGELGWNEFIKNGYNICLLDILLPGEKDGLKW
jgi:DNA-binding response OmpR family regulator